MPQSYESVKLAPRGAPPAFGFVPALTSANGIGASSTEAAPTLHPRCAPELAELATPTPNHDCESFLRDFNEAAAACLPPISRWTNERGVVIVGGAGKYAASLYVTLAMLREVGCTLPVEIWCLRSRGELCPKLVERCARFGPLDWIDGEAHAASSRLFAAGFLPGCEGGWQLKAYAIALSRFDELIYLDADCYPIRDPSLLFDSDEYRQTGAIFWPDMNAGPGVVSREQYAAFGVDGDGRGWESGQIVVHKRRHARALQLALWLNAHATKTYRLIYGDKDTFQMAWRKLRASRFVHDGLPRWEQVAFVHMAPDGKPIFMHRCRDKFRDRGERFQSTPQDHAHPQRVAALPCEDRAHAHFDQFVGQSIKACDRCVSCVGPESLAAWVINLDARPDRWATFNRRLPAAWPFAAAQRFPAIDLRESAAHGGQDGCRESHLRALEQIAASDRDTLLMEDDCCWTPNMQRVVEALRALPADWDCAWLGGHQNAAEPSVEIGSTHWLEARGLTMLHAVLYRGKSADKLRAALASDTSHCAIDMRFTNIMRQGKLRIYRLDPWAAWQPVGPSDLAGERRAEDFWVWETFDEQPHPHGWWLYDPPADYDAALADAIADCVQGSVIDLGCGRGEYVAHLRRRSLAACGFDGNPNTSRYGEHLFVADLARPLETKPADWVLSLGTGAHIPAFLMHNFLNNISLLASQGVILSWAARGERGLARMNELPNEAISELMRQRNWHLAPSMQARLREASTRRWFRDALMVFQRPGVARG